jgi:hypothetical protein
MVSVSKSNGPNYNDPTFAFNVQLAPTWYIQEVSVYATGPNGIVHSQGVPIVNGDWTTEQLSPVSNRFLALFALDPSLAFTDCYELGLRASIVRINLFSQVIPNSATVLYATNDATGSRKYIQDCFERCPPPSTTITQGSCDNCNAEVTATFAYCETVTLSSCKPITKATIVYTDCSSEVIMNPSGVLPMPGGNGKTISDVYVRSGCPTAGPGNPPGQWPGIHFSAPCPAGNCN